MAEHETPAPEELNEEEIAAQNGETLPERAAMSIIHPGPDPIPLLEPTDGITLPVEPPDET